MKLFLFFHQEYITFYSFLAKETSDLKGLDSNFTLKLPFRNVDIEYNSEVKLFGDFFQFEKSK